MEMCSGLVTSQVYWKNIQGKLCQWSIRGRSKRWVDKVLVHVRWHSWADTTGFFFQKRKSLDSEFWTWLWLFTWTGVLSGKLGEVITPLLFPTSHSKLSLCRQPKNASPAQNCFLWSAGGTLWHLGKANKLMTFARGVKARREVTSWH